MVPNAIFGYHLSSFIQICDFCINEFFFDIEFLTFRYYLYISDGSNRICLNREVICNFQISLQQKVISLFQYSFKEISIE